jgi:hypothetical protein
MSDEEKELHPEKVTWAIHAELTRVPGLCILLIKPPCTGANVYWYLFLPTKMSWKEEKLVLSNCVVFSIWLWEW